MFKSILRLSLVLLLFVLGYETANAVESVLLTVFCSHAPTWELINSDAPASSMKKEEGR